MTLNLKPRFLNLILFLILSWSLFYCGKRLPDIVEPLWESGDFTANRTLTGRVYFKGIRKITNNAILTIEPGAEIIFSSEVPSALFISQGSQIIAEGTPTLPITFTSDKASPGAWGGIVIAGRAPVVTEQLPIPTNTNAIPGFSYGGSNITDNSGIFKYVRILYAGGISTDNLDAPSVFNGLTLCGVGNGTVIDYVQVHKSARDAFALFGGTANLRHIIATSSSDDGLYGNESWYGRVQFYIAQMTNRTIGNGVELENQRTTEFDKKWNDTATCNQFRAPLFFNLTIIGRESDRNAPNHAVYLKPGSHGFFRNVITLGFETSKPIRIETDSIIKHFIFWYSSFQFNNPIGQSLDIPNTTFNEQAELMIKQNFENANKITAYQLSANAFSPTSPDFSAVESISGFVINGTRLCADPFIFSGGPYDFMGAVGNNNPAKSQTLDWTKEWTFYP